MTGLSAIALPEYVDDLPNLCGSEPLVSAAVEAGRSTPVYAGRSPIRLADIDAAFAVALHMHQPLIPAGGPDLRGAATISNLQWMQDHPGLGDNHNAPVFRWCYQRMGEIIPQLLDEGLTPRVMLEYSGTLLHGLRKMGAHEVLDALRRITCEPGLRDAVEWLGCPWGHAVAPSTPPQDYRLHVRAWQHHFAAIFGLEALGRVRGFSPSEMALPNHPDVAYDFVRTLVDCGYQYVLVQEHTVELPDGRPLEQQHLPHRLVCTSSAGESAEIIAVVKTQGSDTKLVGQMQPYYEALGLRPQPVTGRGGSTISIPPLVTQIADGENGGVMMNEFPPKYIEVIRACSGSRTPIMNVTEYLEQVLAGGVSSSDLPAIQPILQHRIWERMQPGAGPERLDAVIAALAAEDSRFSVEGGSWTNNVSWVRGYADVLVPMMEASSRFAERVLATGVPTDHPAYRNALFHLLTAETSCYRYWGQGLWTDYGAELARRTIDIVTHDL
jgi:glycosyl hydrolase family 57